MTTGDRIRLRRKEIGKSAEDIATQLGVSPATIYRYENGDIEKVPVDVVIKISKILSVSPVYLMGWSSEATETKNLSEKIRYLRIQKGMTQAELAEKLNTTKQTIGKYENQVVTNLPLNRIQELADALDTTPAYLMGWGEEKPAANSDELTETQKYAFDMLKTMDDSEIKLLIDIFKTVRANRKPDRNEETK